VLGFGGFGALSTLRPDIAEPSPPQGRRGAQPTSNRSAIIRTVLKDVPPDSITGITLIHEHLSMHSASPAPTFYDDVGLIADEVAACARDGVRCIVDAGGQDLGRRIQDLRTIATRSGMLIVACGGLHGKSGYPPDTFKKSEDQIAEDFFVLSRSEHWGAIGEIGTGTAVPMDADERKVLRATATLHARTGLSIITHTSDGCARCAMDQVDLFESAGVPLNHIVIGHLNDITEQPAAVPIAIAKRGAYVAFDHSGRPDDPRMPEYIRTILSLLEAGHQDRLCLSSDFASSKYLRKNGGPGIDMVLTTAVPLLKQAGVSEAILHTILVENPRRVLAFVPKTT
jgi:phosphotriesterase-related protein